MTTIRRIILCGFLVLALLATTLAEGSLSRGCSSRMKPSPDMMNEPNGIGRPARPAQRNRYANRSP